MSCKHGNHTVGVTIDGRCITLDTYVEEGRQHPGRLFHRCPDCGERLFIEDMADAYARYLATGQLVTDSTEPMADPQAELTALRAQVTRFHVTKTTADLLKLFEHVGLPPA